METSDLLHMHLALAGMRFNQDIMTILVLWQQVAKLWCGQQCMQYV